jgi:hypothetical protein
MTSEKFGRDHWSTFGYLETRCVDHKGIPELRHLRLDPVRHPGLAHMPWAQDYPTRLAGGAEQPEHDDWDCTEDLEKAGLLEILGTGIHPVIRLTDTGKKVAGLLRAHKSGGGSFSNFKWSPT